jgi:hypothetical protein
MNITTDFKKNPVFNKCCGKKKKGSHTFFLNIAENVTPIISLQMIPPLIK